MSQTQTASANSSVVRSTILPVLMGLLCLAVVAAGAYTYWLMLESYDLTMAAEASIFVMAVAVVVSTCVIIYNMIGAYTA